jgi:hypothetical protein
VLDRYVEWVTAAGAKVIEFVVPVLVWLFIAAAVVFGVLALAGAFEDRGPACVHTTTSAGQTLCVPR